MAMNTPTNSSDAVLAAILQPHTNFAARSAARQEGLQLQSILTAQQQQKTLEEQQAQAAIDQQLEAERSLPFMGKDVQNLAAEVRKHEKQVFERIRDNYKGDARAFFAAEGKQWQAEATRRLIQSPMYQQATQNRKNVMDADAARQRGERLVGSAIAGGYQTGEQQLQDFLAGKSDTYQHAGSYKVVDGLKGIRESYKPGHYSFEPVQASEQDMLEHLIGQFGQEQGVDMYQRQYRGTKNYYKTAPLEDAFKFQNDQKRMQLEVGRYNLTVSDHAANQQLRGLQAQKLGLDIKEKQQKLSGTAENGLPFDYDLLAHPSEVIKIAHDPQAPKKLPSGYDLSKLNSLAGATLFGNGDEILARQLGLSKSKDGYGRGSIKEGFTTANGTHAINLGNSNFTVVGLEPKVFYSPSDVTPTGLNPNGVNGFARVTIQFNNVQDAARANLYDPNRLRGSFDTDATGIFDSSTPSGTGVYSPESMRATIFVPTGHIDGNRNKPFQKALQKDAMGQKPANESVDSQLPFPTGF